MKKFISIIILITMLLSIFGIQSVKAENAIQEYSEDYKKYLELSDEEKAKVNVIPRMYDVPLDMVYEDTIEVPQEKSIFNLFGAIGGTKLQSSYAEELPSKFSLADKIAIQIENQGDYGNCWNFASIKALETYLALNGYGEYDLSELHLDYMESSELLSNSIRKLHDGGFFSTFKHYANMGMGPVLEEEVPYNEIYTKEQYEYLSNLEPKIFIEETIDFPTINKKKNTYTEQELALFREKIKKHIMENGSLYCAIMSPDDGREYFSTENSAEYYNGDETLLSEDPTRREHAVSIIGWDDDYQKENFNENCRPTKNGAYIILNSWGKDWGDNGLLYVSYEDVEVEKSISGIRKASNRKEDIKYQGEEINFNDKNFYNAIKTKFKNAIISFDDNNLKLTIKKEAIDSTYEIELKNKGIQDLTGIEKFKRVSILDFENNNINSLEPLKQFSTEQQSFYLYFGNNNLSNLNFLENWPENIKIVILDISGNNISDVSNISKLKIEQELNLSNNPIRTGLDKLEITPVLKLNDCGLTDSALEMLKVENKKQEEGIPSVIPTPTIVANNNNSIYNSLKGGSGDDDDDEYYDGDDDGDDGYCYAGKIELKNNLLVDISYLQDFSFESINLSGNKNLNLSKIPSCGDLYLDDCNLLSINGLTDNIMQLSISNNPIGVENLNFLNTSQIWKLNLSNTNITDVESLNNIQSLYELDLSGNKNIVNIQALSNIGTLHMNDCNISDVSAFSNLNNLYSLELKDNKIEKYDSLLELANLNYLDLSNNKISYFATQNEEDKRKEFVILDNNNINTFYKPEHVKSFKNQIIEKTIDVLRNEDTTINVYFPINFKTENCRLDIENNILTFTKENIEKGYAKIIINYFEIGEFTYIYDFNIVDTLKIDYIEIGKMGKWLYMEGEDFNKDEYALRINYKNGSFKYSTDFEVMEGTNLQKEKTNVILKYGDIYVQAYINVFHEDEVTTFRLTNMELYSDIINSQLKDFIILTNDSNKEITMPNLYIDSLNGLTIKNLELNNINDIITIDQITELNLENTNVSDLSAAYNKLQKLGYKSSMNENEFTKIDNKVQLPSIIKYLKDNGNTIKAYVDYNVRDEKYLPTMTKPECNVVEKNGKLLVNLDKSLIGDKVPSNRCVIIEITGDKIRDKSYLKINYTAEDILKLQHKILNNNKYITDIKAKNNLLSKVIADKPTLNKSNIVITDTDGNEVDKNEKIKTGTKIELLDEKREPIDSYIVIVKSDINGDGIFDIIDLSQSVLHIVEKIKLEGIYEMAADINGDNEIDIIDLSQLVLALVGKIEI